MTRRSLLKAAAILFAGLVTGTAGKSKHRLRILPFRCVGCRDCWRICPVDNALIMRRGKAVINQTECNSCMLCESVCSYGAIERCEKYVN